MTSGKDAGEAGSMAGASKDAVHDEADERSAPSAHVVYESIRSEGESELERSSSALAWSALAAGLSMGFSFVAEALLQHHLPEASWRPLVVKLGYSVGFLIVILGRQQLFTENTLTVVLPLLAQRSGPVFRNVIRLWTVVLVANLVGALGFAAAVAHTQVFDPGLRSIFSEIAADAMKLGFGTNLLRAIFAGWLIALMVWLLPFAESARFWVIVVLTYLIGVAHFPHIIAGATEVFFLALTGERTWGQVGMSYLLPTFLGNVIGGVALVAVLAHAQIVGGGDSDES